MTKQEIKNIINNWENKEFGHYQCDCVPATKGQIQKLTNIFYKKFINARIEGAIREIVRLTILMSDGTSAEEYQKVLSILHKEKIMLQGELKKRGINEK